MSKRTLPDKDSRLYHTTIAATTYITTRLRNMKHSLGPRPANEQQKGRMRLYSFVEIIDMALDALERELNREEEG